MNVRKYDNHVQHLIEEMFEKRGKYDPSVVRTAEKLLKEAEQLSASHCEEWQMREKLNSARTIRNIIEQYA